MGDAKRRKKLDPNYGTTPDIPKIDDKNRFEISLKESIPRVSKADDKSRFEISPKSEAIVDYILTSGTCPNCNSKLEKMTWTDGETHKEIPWEGDDGYRCANGCGKHWDADEISLPVELFE
jgi:hypothetical protein